MSFVSKVKKSVKKVKSNSSNYNVISKQAHAIGTVLNKVPATAKIGSVVQGYSDKLGAASKSAVMSYVSKVASGAASDYVDPEYQDMLDGVSVSQSYDTQDYQVGSSGLEPVSMVKQSADTTSVATSTLVMGVLALGFLAYAMSGKKK